MNWQEQVIQIVAKIITSNDNLQMVWLIILVIITSPLIAFYFMHKRKFTTGAFQPINSDTITRLAHVEKDVENLKHYMDDAIDRLEDDIRHEHEETRQELRDTRQEIHTLVTAVTGQSASFLNAFDKLRITLLNQREEDKRERELR